MEIKPRSYMISTIFMGGLLRGIRGLGVLNFQAWTAVIVLPLLAGTALPQPAGHARPAVGQGTGER